MAKSTERVKKYRERHRERYNELQKKYSNAYNIKHRLENREYSKMHYKLNKIQDIIAQETHLFVSVDEFIDQFEGEILSDEDCSEYQNIRIFKK